jgi:hypothetical protein
VTLSCADWLPTAIAQYFELPLLHRERFLLIGV